MSVHSLIKIDQIITGLEQQGFVVVDNALADECLTEIEQYRQGLSVSDYKPAGVGRGQAQTHGNIRNDQIHWLPEGSKALSLYAQAMEALREAINQTFFLGLFDYECHLAQYQPGNFYQKHVDAFRGQSNRKLSSVLYLNDNWQSELSGELIIYQEQNPKLELCRVLPQKGRLVVFFSECFAHEVLPAKQLRNSLTGWFRVRSL